MLSIDLWPLDPMRSNVPFSVSMLIFILFAPLLNDFPIAQAGQAEPKNGYL